MAASNVIKFQRMLTNLLGLFRITDVMCLFKLLGMSQYVAGDGR
jgi:hypothetical protein